MAAKNPVSGIVPKSGKQWLGIMIVAGVGALALNTAAKRFAPAAKVKNTIANGL